MSSTSGRRRRRRASSASRSSSAAAWTRRERRRRRGEDVTNAPLRTPESAGLSRRDTSRAVAHRRPDAVAELGPDDVDLERGASSGRASPRAPSRLSDRSDARTEIFPRPRGQQGSRRRFSRAGRRARPSSPPRRGAVRSRPRRARASGSRARRARVRRARGVAGRHQRRVLAVARTSGTTPTRDATSGRPTALEDDPRHSVGRVGP